MTQRTCNIIMCCKGNDYYGYKADPLYSIKEYLSHECQCSKGAYTSGVLESILFSALCDYIDTAKKPSYVLWSLREDGKYKNNLSEKIITMFSLVQVRNEEGYVNGFSKELIDQSNIDLNYSKKKGKFYE